MHRYSELEDDIYNTCWFFESIEKLRTACARKLTHIGKRRQCTCGTFYYPRIAKTKCPECDGKLKSVKKVMTCPKCGYKAGELGCPVCHKKDKWTAAPKDIPLIRENVLPRLTALEDETEATLIALVHDHPVWDWASHIRGIGPTSVGRMLSATDIGRCTTLSKFFAHTGWGLRKDGTPQRKIRGERLDYDTRAQSIAYELAVSLEKQTGERLGVRYAETGKYYQFYQDWKHENLLKGLSDGQATSRAFRNMIQLMLSHFYEVWRKGVNLPYAEPFAYTVLSPPQSLGTKIKPESMKQKS